MKRRARTLRGALVAACAALLLALGPGAWPAGAHTVLVGSQPAAGGRLERPPRRVVLRFDDPVESRFAAVTLSGPSRLRGRRARHPGGNQRALSLRLAGAPRPGRYRLSWRVLAQDGHVAGGSYRFRLRPPSPPQPRPGAGGRRRPALVPGTSHSHIVGPEGLGRLLALVGLGGLLGGAAYLLFVVRPAARRAVAQDGPGDELEQHAWRALLCSALLLVAGAAFSILAAAAAASGRSVLATPPERWLEVALDTRFGRVWTAVLAVAAALTIVLAWARRRKHRVLALGAALLAGAAVAAAPGVSGHARLASPAAAMVAADALHVGFAALWIGALGYLVFAMPAALARAPDDQAGALVRAALERFGPLALLAVAVVAVTGVARSVPLVGSLDALFKTTYGQLLMFKVLLVLVVLGLAATTRLLLLPALRARPAGWRAQLRGTLAIELLFGAVVIALSAILAFAPPAFKRTDLARPAAGAPLDLDKPSAEE